MRPDASALLLTTLIGAGQGLFLALFTVQAYALFGLLPVQHGHTFYAHGSLVALVLLASGLAASFFHLGRPERAWRSAAPTSTHGSARRLPTSASTAPSPARPRRRSRVARQLGCRWRPRC